MWSDPIDNDKGDCPEKYKFNEVRGCSYFYGAKAASDFLDANELLTIIRAHEAQLEGYKMHKWNDSDFPLVITIFSAPNYCDAYNNKGAVIKFDVPVGLCRIICSISNNLIIRSIHICCPTSWTSSRGRYHSWGRRVIRS